MYRQFEATKITNCIGVKQLNNVSMWIVKGFPQMMLMNAEKYLRISALFAENNKMFTSYRLCFVCCG